MPVDHFIGLNQVEEAEFEVAQDFIRHVYGKKPPSLEYIVEMGLTHARLTREAPLRRLAAMNAAPQVFEQPLLQLQKVHVLGCPGIFLSEIGY